MAWKPSLAALFFSNPLQRLPHSRALCRSVRLVTRQSENFYIERLIETTRSPMQIVRSSRRSLTRLADTDGEHSIAGPKGET
jgi:hypothetical protein